MSILKKITSFLFEEQEDEIIEDDEIQPVTMKSSAVETKREDSPKAEEVVKVEEEIVEKPKEPVSKFVDITDNDPIEEKKEVVKETKVEPVKKEVKKEYEFTPVISPMFGVTEEEIKASKKANVKPVATHHMKKKNNPIGTILSPFYGLSEESPFETPEKKVNNDIKKPEPVALKKEEVVQEVVQKPICENTTKDEVLREQKDSFEPEIPFEKSNIEQQEDVLLSNEKQTLSKEEVLLKEEASSIPLEELISEDKSSEEDLMQISLFGESTPIEECKTDNILDE